MRRFQALLLSAGLAAAPASAVAGPSHDHGSSDAQTFERFTWWTNKGRLGLQVMSLTPELRKHLGAAEDRGVLVARVEDGAPAATAGVAVGDVIIAVHGQKVDSAADVMSALAGLGKGQDVAVDVVRDGKPMTLHAKLDTAAPRSLLEQPWSGSDWFRDWMKPFDDENGFAPFDQPGWRHEGKRDEPGWLRKLREWFQPANPIEATLRS